MGPRCAPYAPQSKLLVPLSLDLFAQFPILHVTSTAAVRQLIALRQDAAATKSGWIRVDGWWPGRTFIQSEQEEVTPSALSASSCTTACWANTHWLAGGPSGLNPGRWKLLTHACSQHRGSNKQSTCSHKQARQTGGACKNARRAFSHLVGFWPARGWPPGGLETGPAAVWASNSCTCTRLQVDQRFPTRS